MIPTQTPNYFKVGLDNLEFEASRPFTFDRTSGTNGTTTTSSNGTTTTSSNGTTTNAAVPARPTIQGPATLPRSSGPPAFTLNPGPNPYAVVEVANRADLFEVATEASQRSDANFFGTWSDGTRVTGTSYQLPQTAWDRLKASDRLFYRVGALRPGTAGTTTRPPRPTT